MIFNVRQNSNNFHNYIKNLNIPNPIKMLHKIYTHALSYLVFLNIRRKNLHILWKVIKIMNTIFIMFKLLENQVKTYIAGTPAYRYIRQVYNIMEGYYCTTEKFNGNIKQCYYIKQIGYAISTMFLMLLMAVFFFRRLQVNLTDTQKYNKFIGFILYLPLLILVIIQIIYYFLSSYLINSFMSLSDILASHQSLYIIFLLALTTLLWFIVTIYNYSNRIFSLFVALLIVFQQLLDILPACILVAILAGFLLYKEPDPLSRCIYASFIVVSCFEVLENIIHQQSRLNGNYQSIIYMGVGVLFIIVVTACQAYIDVKPGTDKHNNLFLVNCIRKLQQNDPQKLTYMQLLKIETIYRNFFQKQKEFTQKFIQLHLVKYPIKSLTYEKFKQVVDMKLKIDSDKDLDDIEMKQIFLLFRIMYQYKIYQSIDGISLFMDSQSIKQNRVKYINFADKYIQKNVQQVMFQQFLSKQPQNQRVNQLIKMSKIQQQFVQLSMQILTDISSFWQKIKMQILVEQIIEQIFYKIIQSTQKLKLLLAQLRTGYKAEWQSKIMKMIIKLIEPSINQNGIESDLFSDRYRTVEMKQDTLLFFVIRNRIITSASPTFLKIIDCSNQQIINCSLQKIVPPEIIKLVRQKQNQVIKSPKMSNIIPIICGEDLIRVYQTNVKLQPKANSGIEFFYFLKNIQTEQKFAYLYINSVDLMINYVSMQFYQVFSLSRQHVRTKIKNQDFYFNSMINDFDANEIVPTLLDRKAIRCNLCVKFMRIKQSNKNIAHKYGGIINLAASFGRDLLISIQIQQIYEMPSNDDLKLRLTVQNMQSSAAKRLPKRDSIRMNNSDFAETNLLTLTTLISNFHINTQEQIINSDPQLPSSIFCPIPNPYKQKIQQKQIELNPQTKNVLSYTSLILGLTLVFLIILISISSLLIFYSRDRDSNVAQALSHLNQSADFSNQLIKSTFQVYYQYVIQQNADYIDQFLAFQSNHSNLTTQNVLAQQYEYIHQNLYLFQNSFSKFFHREIFSSLTYKIVYQYYQFQAYYSSTNLIDYVYNLKLTSEELRIYYQSNSNSNSNMTQIQNYFFFLMNNNQIISKIKAPFQILSTLITLHFTNELKVKIIIGSMCMLSFIIFIALLVIIKHILCVVRDVFYIFSVLSQKDISKRFQQLLRGSELYIRQVPKDSLKKLSDLKRRKQKTMVLYESKARKSTKFMKKQDQNNRKQFQDLVSSKIILSNKENPYITSMGHLKGIVSLTLCLFLVVGMFFYKMEIELNQNKVIMEYYNQIKILKNEIIETSTQMMEIQMAKLIYNVTKQVPQQTQIKKSSVDKKLGLQFYENFKDFFAEQNKRLKQNLCQSKIEVKKRIIIDIMVCQQIGLGILQNGFVQASQYFEFMTLKLKKQEMGLFQVGDNEEYPYIFLHVYVKQKILGYFDQLEVILLDHLKKLEIKYQQSVILFGVSTFLIEIIILFYIGKYFIPRVFNIKTICIGYFKIISKQILSRLDVSAYLNSKKILAKLSLL